MIGVERSPEVIRSVSDAIETPLLVAEEQAAAGRDADRGQRNSAVRAPVVVEVDEPFSARSSAKGRDEPRVGSEHEQAVHEPQRAVARILPAFRYVPYAGEDVDREQTGDCRPRRDMRRPPRTRVALRWSRQSEIESPLRCRAAAARRRSHILWIVHQPCHLHNFSILDVASLKTAWRPFIVADRFRLTVSAISETVAVLSTYCDDAMKAVRNSI